MGLIGLPFSISLIMSDEKLRNSLFSWIEVGTLGTIVAYNLTVDTEDVSRSEIFRNDLIGLHVHFAIVEINGWWLTRSKKHKKAVIGIQSTRDGRGLVLNVTYKF